MKTGWTACQVGLAAFIVPFMFAYSPSLVLIGTGGEILLAFITASIGVVTLAAAMQGWIWSALPIWSRAICFACALLLIKPGVTTDIAGAIGLAIVMLQQMTVVRRTRSQEGMIAEPK